MKPVRAAGVSPLNLERLAGLLECPVCGKEMRYRPKARSYSCSGQVLHAFRVNGEIVDLVAGPSGERQDKVNRAFGRIAGRTYEKNATGASVLDRIVARSMWGTTRFIPLLFEMLSSVACDCDPGYFLDIPVGTGVFTAGEYSLQPNLDFIAVDYNLQMLSSALEKVRVEDFANVMLIRADAANLPFADGVFSGILTMNGIGAFPDKPKALDEFVRVLKPGGKLAGSLYVRGERLVTDIVIGRFAARFGWFTRPIYTEEDFLAELESRGIERVVTKKLKTILFFSGKKARKESSGAVAGRVNESEVQR